MLFDAETVSSVTVPPDSTCKPLVALLLNSLSVMLTLPVVSMTAPSPNPNEFVVVPFTETLSSAMFPVLLTNKPKPAPSVALMSRSFSVIFPFQLTKTIETSKEDVPVILPPPCTPSQPPLIVRLLLLKLVSTLPSNSIWALSLPS